jgi:hypothetical protein
LFANWVAWHRARLPWWRRAPFELKVLAAWVFQVWERTLNGTKAVSNAEISIRQLMTVCLSENDRRFAGYDSRLLRPDTVPRLVRFALRFLKRRG